MRASQLDRALRRDLSFLLQLVAHNPSVLPIMGLNPIPVGGRNHDQDFGASWQGLQRTRSVKGRGLERRSGRLYLSLHLTAKVLDALFQTLRGDRLYCDALI